LITSLSWIFMPNLRALVAAAFLLSATAAPLLAQTDSSTLTLDRIFASHEFDPEFLGDPKWLQNLPAYVKIEPDSATKGGRALVRYDAASGRREVWVPAARLVPAGDSLPLPVESYEVSADGKHALVFTNSRKVWRQNTRGDYWALDLTTWKLQKLGGAKAAPSTLMFAKFSPDGGRVAYVREHDLYVERLADGAITQLTRDGSRTIINGTFDWVYEEELNLRDGFRWSPDGRRIAFWQLDASGVKDFDLIDDTDSLYSFVVPVQYPKAGTTNSAARVGIVSAAAGAPVWLDVPGDPRNNYIAKLEWAASSNEVALEHMNRAQNTIEVVLGDAATGKTRVVHTERDSAWVDVDDDLRWIDGGKSFTWISERDGWRHLYVISRDGTKSRLVTPGAFDLHNPYSAFGEPYVVGVDSAAGYVYYTASPDNPTQLYLYRTRLDGKGKQERITPKDQPGYHNYTISKDGRWALHTWSRFDTPGTVEVVKLPGHQRVRTLVENRRLNDAVARLRRGTVEFTKVDVGNGLALDAWIMKPPGFDSTKRYPVLFYVYGEPASQTVLDQWGYAVYLWHLMLTQHGYIVISVDNRGTPSPRGRAFRKVIYKKIGLVNSADQAAAARTIRRWRWVDSTRIGMWGWSGGGSTTLNAMFRYPEVYQTGLSVAPAPDQRLYDTIYTERYWGLPQENEQVYHDGSPVFFADSLRGNLLVVHGSGDDNVHYQGTERLVNALVAANRPFTMMVYPNRTHCICEGQGTGLHLFSLLTRYLEQNLPAGGR
jgi:dipeptidyl-peptidase 4